MIMEHIFFIFQVAEVSLLSKMKKTPFAVVDKRRFFYVYHRPKVHLLRCRRVKHPGGQNDKPEDVCSSV